MISVGLSTGPIFHQIFTVWYVFDCRLPIWPTFSDDSRDVAMATNFKVIMGEIGRHSFIRCRGIPKRLGISPFWFQNFIWDDLATSCKKLLNLGPEFKKSKDVHSLVDQQFGYAAPLLDFVGISSEFSEAITTQFCFTYTPEGVTAMPRGLHARLCHVFLDFGDTRIPL